MEFSPVDLQNSFGNYSFRSSSSSTTHDDSHTIVPHQGRLCRVEGKGETTYVLEILLESGSSHELIFRRKDFDFSLRLFSIMDTESRGRINKATVEEFMALRCPIFWRRDEDLEDRAAHGTSPTFEEVWTVVTSCSTLTRVKNSNGLSLTQIGVEGWMVFCRFIALAQYLEAKRRFSGRHLQQTMRHRNAPRGSELVMVDVPPAAAPVALTADALAQYELENQKCLPLPELDLDHSLLAAHDVLRRRRRIKDISSRSTLSHHVKIDLFGPSPLLLSSSSATDRLEFCLTLIRRCGGENDRISEDAATVRRSMKDIEWLNDTFVSQKALGGTLCGRILPPFPGNQVLSRALKEDSSFVITGGAIAAATNAGKEFANAGVGIASAGVGILKEGIKSLWGGYISTSDTASKSYPEKSKSKKSASMVNTMQTYYNPNSPIRKAQHLERYLNYLLEHPALSTSFPLNTILKASQSGLEAAKQSLEEHTRAAREIKVQTPHMDDGKTSTFWNLHSSGSSMQPNLAWVRTAAQAAVALQLHGILETTGLPSASARLQHASLPSFNNSRNSEWADDDGDRLIVNDSEDSSEIVVEDSFEEGVLHVQDELASDSFMDQCEDEGEGYDLLPLPVPAPERQILSVSEAKRNSSAKKETRFRYGGPSLQEGLVPESTEDEKRVYLGEMAIDENIDKLREVIESVDNTLSRCMASSCGIERSRREGFMINLDILRGLDSWEGLRGKFVSQRALLKGVSNMEQSREVFEESDLTLIDDISWQTALAHSAVSAAEDVRSTVRAARTACNAKFAAVSAAHMAQDVCKKGKFPSINEARAAQTRASIAQSHAIHAAVVEHEAKTVKRRAILALAHDVKCWNEHRKREVLKVCLTHAKSQHEATRRAVDAWSCLRDGFVGSTIIPSTQAWKPTKKKIVLINEPEVKTTIFGNSDKGNEGHHSIVAVEHENLKLPTESLLSKSSNNIGKIDVSHTYDEPDPVVSLVVASPIPEVENTSNSRNTEGFSIQSTNLQTVEVKKACSGNHKQPNKDCLAQAIMVSKSSISFEKEMIEESSENENDETLTSSMQSLVDGLMNWGGIDVEDSFALPTGMAASIALEESAAFGNNP